MTTDYTALDAAILDAIRGGKTTFFGIDRAVRSITGPLDRSSPWRITERRMQVLRKAGQIKFRRKEWRIA